MEQGVPVIDASPALPADEDELARLVRQSADADGALQSYLASHGQAIPDQGGPSLQLRAAQHQLLASEKQQRKQRMVGDESLRESAHRFRALIEHSRDGLSLVDAGDRILYLSPGVMAIGGYSEAELLGRHGMATTHPDDLAMVKSIIADVQAHPGKSTEMVWRRLHKNGNVVWLEGAVTNLLHDPAVRAMVTNYRDVTDRKRAEADNQRSQSLLRMANRLGRIGPWSMELPSQSLFWSDEVRNIHEVATEYIPGMESTFDFYPPGSRAMVRNALEACMCEGTPFDIEMQVITAKGRQIWIRAIGEAVRDDSGAIFRVQGAYQDISERKQAAEEIRRVAECLTTTFESITESFFTLDHDWRFTYVNRQAESVFQKPRTALLGNIVWEVFPQIVDTIIDREFRRAIAGNAAIEFEVLSPTFKIWLDVRAYPSAQGLAVYFRDVSAQRKAHESLIVSEERYRLLARATNEAIWDFDAIIDRVTWNEGFEKLFGYARTDGEMTMAAWRERIHPGDLARVIEKMETAIAHGNDNWSDEFRFRRKDGGHSYVLNRCHIIRNAGGQTARIIGGMTDLTTRKKAEGLIAEQAALLDKARDAISVRDLTHNVSYWNKSAERIYGWAAAEIIGQSVRDLLFKDATAFDQAVQEAIARGEWIGELSPTSKDGRKLLIDGRLTLVRDSAGNPLSILSICTDITERRKLEQQYLRAQRLESIGTLAGGIAHDLNNVLAPIMLSITLLSKGEKDEKRLGMLAIIDASAKRGADMVRHVLSFARGVEGQRLPIQIPNLLREIEKIINDTFLKNIQVITTFAHDVWMVSGDSTQLHQVLLNLCVNARDAMPEGGVLTLTVENATLDDHFAALHIDAKPGPYVVIGVEDTGTGISPELIEKIFEPFFTTKEIGKGTGLGLSISLAVVKSHNGFMGVYSEPGKGTAFKLYLPAMPASTPESVVPMEPTLPPGHGELIMVVDDEYSVRQITRQTLEAFGYRVVLASDGSEALAIFALQQNDISLVITDMMMPIMDGNATIRVLTKIRPGVRIIAASGLNENHVIAKAMSNGVKHFVAKPYTAETLLTKIREALQ
jgi:PAS domain S-box-containing protein